MTASPRHIALAALVLAIGSQADARENYQVTALQSLGEPGSWAWDVNNAGQIAGHAFASPEPVPGTDLWVSSARAVLWSAGSTEELGSLPGGSVSIAHGVNDGGQVVGRSRPGTAGLATAFKWQAGAMTPLSTPAGHESEAFAINAAGDAAGLILLQGQQVLSGGRAVRWQDGVMDDLHHQAWQASGATAINAAGTAAGWYTAAWPAPQRAVLWTAAGQTVELGTLNGTPYSVARAVTDSEVAVGYSGYEWAPNNWVNRAFLWQAGAMTDLGALGGQASEAFDVNATGQVVGTAETATGATHAFLWDGAQMIDLNDRIPADSQWELLAATGINAQGQIVGYGMYEGEVAGFQLQATAPDPCPADINGDGRVDVMDLMQIVSNWGACPNGPACTGDVDFDATIGAPDLVLVISNWGDCPDT